MREARESSLQIVYTDPGGEGYHCLLHMARLAAELLNGELVVVTPQNPTWINKLSGILLPWSGSHSACLLICPSSADLSSVLLVRDWLRPFRRVVAWVFDSFWTNWIPPWTRASRLFDHIFVTEQEDLHTWRRLMHAPVDWLPWGSDVLRLGSANTVRPFDLLRFGRQPKEWDDDLVNRERCQSIGLNFHGRPKSWNDATDNQRGLMQMLSSTKFSLAFTNRVSPGTNTHPEREYITGRWADSLASGASIAGIPPRSESVQSLLWPEALFDLGTVNQNEGLKLLNSKVRAWTPELAQVNYLRALETLDWRLRFQKISQALEVSSPKLEEELERLSQAVNLSRSTGAGRCC